MESYEKDLYFVAVKLLIRDGSKLLITHDIFGSWDLPGGRIKKDEFKASLPSVIKRKIQEELGNEFRYSFGEPIVFFRVEREEHNLDNKKVRIFAIGYDAVYEGGDVQLGDHHDRYEWVDVESFKPEDYFVDGWLEGVQEYLTKQAKIGFDNIERPHFKV
jgi:8-oxo-dGTP pyrophosphatase MutT (NUDIX family)